MRCEPAFTIVERFGGAKSVSDITGAHVSRVSRWQAPKDKGGTGGMIPHWHIEKLLAYAREHSIEVTAEDFFRTDVSTPAPAQEGEAA